MADSDDDEGGDDLLFLALVIGGAYVFAQLWRHRLAAAAGGGSFAPAPPPNDVAQGVLNYLVPLSLSPTGAAFIKANEGFRAAAYPDAGGQSIGYGHKIQPGENIVSPISQGEADSLFASDIGTAVRAVSDGLKVQVSQSQFDALVDLAYNIGTTAFLNSTLLSLLNSGDFQGASQQFSQWIHSGGQVNSDLVARRQADQNLFATG